MRLYYEGKGVTPLCNVYTCVMTEMQKRVNFFRMNSQIVIGDVPVFKKNEMVVFHFFHFKFNLA